MVTGGRLCVLVVVKSLLGMVEEDDASDVTVVWLRAPEYECFDDDE